MPRYFDTPFFDITLRCFTVHAELMPSFHAAAIIFVYAMLRHAHILFAIRHASRHAFAPFRRHLRDAYYFRCYIFHFCHAITCIADDLQRATPRAAFRRYRLPRLRFSLRLFIFRLLRCFEIR